MTSRGCCTAPKRTGRCSPASNDIPLARLAREPYFVPESVTLIELLEQFRARRVHMGLVVDEHGGLDGLVTLEDILEELGRRHRRRDR